MGTLLRNYHSYPDPNEKPVISSSRSNISSVAAIPKDEASLALSTASSLPMDAEYPGFSFTSREKTTSTAPFPTKQSRLSNGLTVVSQDSFSLMTSLALVVGSGSANERQVGEGYNGGVTNMIELMAFKSTVTMREHEIKTKIEELGGMAQCVANRESILYCVDVLRSNVEPALELLRDTVLSPLYSEEVLEDGRATMGFISDELKAEVLSRDAIVQAAYPNEPLGNFHMCPLDKTHLVTEASIQKFRQDHFYGENCLISGKFPQTIGMYDNGSGLGAGIDHETLAKLTEKYFSGLPSKGVSADKVIEGRPRSVYSGGMMKNERHLKEPFIKVCLGFEVGGWTSEAFTTVCVLQQLLGGGSSFSAGGPGKGMYSRLYREVLNR